MAAAPSDGEDENDAVPVDVGAAGGAAGSKAAKIMDEDEWTEQNFGASSLINVEDDDEEGTNTSDDSVSDLDTESDSSDYSEEDDEEEVVQVRPRRSTRHPKNSDDEPSQYENVKKGEHR